MGILPQRPLYRRFLILGGLLGVILTALGCWAIYSRSSLSGRIAAIRAAGYPATIADLAPAPIPAADDAAAQLADVAEQFDEFSRDLGRFYKTPAGVAYDERHKRSEAVSTEQLDSIRAIMEKYPDLDAAITRAASCRAYASRLDFNLPQPQFLQAMIDQSSDIRTVARFIQWQMELAIAEGRSDVAVEKGITLLRLAALYDVEPGVSSSMVAMAMRENAAARIYDALADDDNRSVSPELRHELDLELARFRAEEALRHSIATERAQVISATQHQIGGMKSIVANTVGMPMKMMYVESIDVIDPILELAEQPWHETFKPGSQNVFQATGRMGAIAGLLAPSFKAHFDAVHRTTARLRSLRVFNALQLYMDEHGQEAAGLSDLNLPADAGIDPFNGQPLIVKRTEEGWFVYSVGTNGSDDGGNFDKHQDIGVGPSQRKSPAEEGE
jgi:hypothetical protein